MGNSSELLTRTVAPALGTWDFPQERACRACPFGIGRKPLAAVTSTALHDPQRQGNQKTLLDLFVGGGGAVAGDWRCCWGCSVSVGSSFLAFW